VTLRVLAAFLAAMGVAAAVAYVALLYTFGEVSW
jgi:hypothetical protein